MWEKIIGKIKHYISNNPDMVLFFGIGNLGLVIGFIIGVVWF